MSLAPRSIDVEVEFDELSLWSYQPTSQPEQFGAIHAAGKVTIRAYEDGDWCVCEIAIDRYGKGAGGMWERGQSVLPLDNPFHALVKAAIEKHLVDQIEDAIKEARAEDGDAVRYGRAA
jgi:hypothetical protein